MNGYQCSEQTSSYIVTRVQVFIWMAHGPRLRWLGGCHCQTLEDDSEHRDTVAVTVTVCVGVTVTESMDILIMHINVSSLFYRPSHL